MKQVLYSFALFGALTVAAPAAIGQTHKVNTNGDALQLKQELADRYEAARQRKSSADQRTPVVANQSGERGGPVANDDCAGAIMLIVGTECVATAGTAVGATESVPADDCAGFTSTTAVDVWYSFVATSTSTTVQVTGLATTDSTGYDAVLIVYEGDCGGLSVLGCADATLQGATETATVPTAVGTTYYYRTYYYDYLVPQIDLEFSTCVFGTPPPPANDMCSSVIPDELAVGSSVAYSGTTAWATADGDYVQSALLTDPAVWQAFTTTECSNVNIDYCGSVPVVTNFYIVLATTCPLDTAAIVFNSNNNSTDCADGNTTLVFNGLPAGTYYVPVLGQGGAYEMTVSAAACTAAPANDDCAGATMLTPALTCNNITGSTAGATQTMAPILCNEFTSPNSNDLFYSFVATGTDHTITVTGIGAFDGVLEFFTGTCAGLIPVSCTDDTFPQGAATADEVMVQSGLTAGITYFFRLYDYANASTGDYEICVTGEMPIGIEDLTNNSAVALFPNPGTGIFTLRALNTSGLSTIEVFDVTGRTVYNQMSQLNKGADHVMDLTGLNAGNYNVRVTANGVRTTQRLVIK